MENGKLSLNYAAGYKDALRDSLKAVQSELVFSNDGLIDGDFLAIEIKRLEEKIEQEYNSYR